VRKKVVPDGVVAGAKVKTSQELGLYVINRNKHWVNSTVLLLTFLVPVTGQFCNGGTFLPCFGELGVPLMLLTLRFLPQDLSV